MYNFYSRFFSEKNQENLFFLQKGIFFESNIFDWITFDIINSGFYGKNLISEYVKFLPNQPGIYRMLDKTNNVLYIGKAKNLRKRVSNYKKSILNNFRIEKMISMTEKMDFIVTKNEKEALLLEANFIKKLSPRFNILLRDDKALPFITITNHHEAPAIEKYRGQKNYQGSYFGPFSSSNSLKDIIKYIQKHFLLRTCTDFSFKKRSYPCVYYQIQRCSAPCVNKIPRNNYLLLVKEAKLFLSKTIKSFR